MAKKALTVTVHTECGNCGATLMGPYCFNCGQHAHESVIYRRCACICAYLIGFAITMAITALVSAITV